MYGPGNNILVRQALKDNYINGLAIKKGTLVTIIPFSNHFSEKYFKNPYEFRPERWLNG
jgi:cytochrome P450